MTTSVEIRPAGHKVRVQTFDRVWDDKAGKLKDEFAMVNERVLNPGDATLQVHATRTREIRVVDLEPDSA